jgi:hypothetical protein
MNKLFTLLLLTISVIVFSQNSNSNLSNIYPDVVPEKYVINPNEKIDAYFSLHPEQLKDENTKQYIFELQYYYRELFESPLISKNSHSVEKYLNDILTLIINDSIIAEYNLNVVVSNEFDINASATDDGTIIFNSLNFNYFNTEAEIAFILAHEVAHILERHGVDLNELFDRYVRKGRPHIKRKLERLSKSSETLADKMAVKFIESSNYNVNRGLDVFEIFKKLEIKSKLIKTPLFSSQNYLKTHPISKLRIDSLNQWITDKHGEDFIIDKELFLIIKKESALHTIENYFYHQEYSYCYELALESYFNSKDDSYIFFILESLRKLMLKNPVNINKLILSERYNSTSVTPVISSKIFINKSDTNLINELRNKKVKTYLNYFDYFKEIAISKDLKDCYLTIGLYNFKKSNSSDTFYLNKYLETNQTKYKNYVEYLINKDKTLNTSPYNNKIIINELYTFKYYNTGFPVRMVFDEDTLSPMLHKFIDTTYNNISNTTNSVISIDKNKLTNYNQYLTLNRLFQLFRTVKEEKVNTKTVDLYLLEPDLYNYMYDNNISRLDFIEMYTARDGYKGLKVAGALVTGVYINTPMWIYSLNYYSFKNSTKQVNKISYDVGGYKGKAKNSIYVLKNYILTKINYSKK